MVGAEVSGFLLPIGMSLLIAIGLLIAPGSLPRPFQSRKYVPLLLSILVGASAVGIYSVFVVR